MLLLGGVIATPTVVQAQKAKPVQTPALASAPLPTAPDISILLLAIEDLPTPGGVDALPPAPTELIPGAIRSHRSCSRRWCHYSGSLAALSPPQWIASAQKKNTADDLFKPEPDFSGRGVPRNTPPVAPPVLPAAAPLQPPPPMGRTHASAITLRRALLALATAMLPSLRRAPRFPATLLPNAASMTLFPSAASRRARSSR